MSNVKFGVTNFPYIPLYDRIRQIALQCENLGYHSLWADDHLMMGQDPVFESFALVSALSRETKKIRLGTLVACNSYRNPALTAKISSTLDVISNGRLTLGYGAGWHQNEYEAYGYPFPKGGTRVRQMREGVIILKKLWTEERASFSGDFYNIKDATCHPKPLQKPHPPIVIGGWGNLILKTAAELGDGWNTWNPPLEEYKRRIDTLTKYCDGFGRRIEDIELSIWGPIVVAETKRQVKRKIEKHIERIPDYKDWLLGGLIGGGCTFDECIKVLQEYVNLGCKHFIFSIITFDEEKEAFMERVGSSF